MALLNYLAKLLRQKYVSKRLAYKIWLCVSNLNQGKIFFFPLEEMHGSLIYGGICGISTNALFFEIDQLENELLPIVKNVLKKTEKPIVLDVGANNGQTLVEIKRLNREAEIHCFEPFPQLASWLDKLVEINHFNSVKINNCALGESSTPKQLHFLSGSTDTASTVEGFQSLFNDSIMIEICKLDDYIKRHEISEITLIKIDVEGGELEVLQGALQTLHDKRPDLILELLFTRNDEHLHRQHQTVALLKDFGYRFYLIQQNGQLNYQEPVTPDPSYKFLNYFVSARCTTEYT